MRYWCTGVVSYFGTSWNFIGWGLFLSWFFVPFFLPSIVLWLALSVLLLAWWVIDAVDQEVAWWQMMIVVLLLAAGFLPLPRAGWLTIAAWVVYYLRFREWGRLSLCGASAFLPVVFSSLVETVRGAGWQEGRGIPIPTACSCGSSSLLTVWMSKR